MGKATAEGGGAMTRWRAEPQTVPEARAQLAVLPPPRGDFMGLLRQLTLRWWAQAPADALYATVRARLTRQPPQAAVWALTWGQLHLACRLEGAWTHLDAGFRLAAPWLAADDYLLLLRRHQRLRPLVLLPRRQPGLTLAELQTLADVTARLGGGCPGRHHHACAADVIG